MICIYIYTHRSFLYFYAAIACWQKLCFARAWRAFTLLEHFNTTWTKTSQSMFLLEEGFYRSVVVAFISWIHRDVRCFMTHEKSHRQMRQSGKQLLLLAPFDFWLHYRVALQWAIAACGDEWWVGGALPRVGVRGGTKFWEISIKHARAFARGTLRAIASVSYCSHFEFVFCNHFSQHAMIASEGWHICGGAGGWRQLRVTWTHRRTNILKCIQYAIMQW